MISITIILSGCTSTAESFDSQQIDNGYNNSLAGGNMAYINNSLYLVYNSGDVLNIGTYKINNNGVECIFENAEADDIFTAPRLYQYNNQLYSVDCDKSAVLKYDSTEKKFLLSEFSIKPCSDKVYISDDLLVWYSDTEGTLNVKYKNSNEYTLDKQVYSYYVSDNVIYFMDCNGLLYSNDVTSGGDSKFINKLNDYSTEIMSVCNGYCYYTYDGNNLSDYKSGLYRYSFTDDKSELILEEEVFGLNTYDDKMYIASESGIYADNGSNCQKFSDIVTKEIYILDNEWIYTNDNSGNIFRISIDKKSVEKIDF